MNTSESAITFASGQEQLVGILHLPDTARNLGILILVGGPQYRVGAHRQFLHWARAFAEAGFPVLRFDYAGTGDSSGEFQGFEQTRADIEAALAQLATNQPQITEICLVGLCDGASAALIHGAAQPEVTHLILINPWVWSDASESQTYIKHYYRGRLADRGFWKKLLTGKVSLGPAIADFRRRLAGAGASATDESGSGYQSKMANGLLRFSGETLIVLSDNDLVAKDFEDAASSDPTWRKAIDRENVRTLYIADSDHTFSRPGTNEQLIHKMLDWIHTAMKSDPSGE